MIVPITTLEGYGLKICMNMDGVVGTPVKSSGIMGIKEVLGIEAARRNDWDAQTPPRSPISP